MDYSGLIAECEAHGATAIFEWIGPHNRIKVKETETQLVPTQVRQKGSSSGEYWYGERREDLGSRYRVTVAQRVQKFECTTLALATKKV